MVNRFKTLGSALGLLTVCASVGNADGVDPIFNPDGIFIDDIEIIGDVTMPSGQTYAVLEMSSEHMRFYVDPDAIYVTMDESNPIIVKQTPFHGFWLSTQTIDNTNWPACRSEAFDEYGKPYQAYGDLNWTNTGIADNGYELAFIIDLGTCDSAPQEWGLSQAVLAMAETGDARDGYQEPPFTLTDANNVAFTVQITPDGTTLDSVNPREIVIMSDGSVSGVFNEHENLAMYADCSAFSPRRGWGNWAWANGGFFIDYSSASFSFPRMDAPIENGGDCRL